MIASQFPKWQELSIEPVSESGWDNRTFHLGKEMSVRMPSAAKYELGVEKEHLWLPKLALALPLPIPGPIAMGKPEHDYPWNWSIYRWLGGVSAASESIENLPQFAEALSNFLLAMHKIDATGGPSPGLHSCHRGGPLSVYDPDMRRAISSLKGKIDATSAIDVWEAALSSSWEKPPVWIHGDISAGNLLVKEGKLSGVIDFGQLAVGDPACDLQINWTLFKGKSRDAFQKILSLDKGSWARARGWVLWKSLIVAAGFTDPNNFESKRCWQIIEDILLDHQKTL